MAGSPAGHYMGGVGPPELPTTTYGNPATFTAAANKQASDYDRIMAQYENIIKNSQTNPIAPGRVDFQRADFNEVTPQTANYRQSGDVTKSLSDLSNLADTGGYTPEGIADIRARDISPIRSIYANAQQNIERAKRLGGGYSPNYNATTAQLSRDEANKIGDVNTAANAGIAQNVAANRLAATPAYAGASATANAAQTAADQKNADIINQINAFNAQGALEVNKFNSSGANNTNQFNVQSTLDAAKANKSNVLGAVQGQASLYGTTPALTKTFGDQVTQASDINQRQQQLNDNRTAQMYSTFIK